MKATDEEVAILQRLGFTRAEWTKRETWELDYRVKMTKRLAGWDGPHTLAERLAAIARDNDVCVASLLDQVAKCSALAAHLRKGGKCDTE